jgi:hypothetical protein
MLVIRHVKNADCFNKVGKVGTMADCDLASVIV